MNAIRRMFGLKRKRRRVRLVMPPPPPPVPRPRQKTSLMPLPPGQLQVMAPARTAPADADPQLPSAHALAGDLVAPEPGSRVQAVPMAFEPPGLEPGPEMAEPVSPAARAEALVRDPRHARGAMRAAVRRRIGAALAATGAGLRRAARFGVFYGLPALVAAVPVYLLIQEMRAAGVEVTSVSVPAALAERGLPAPVVARRLIDQIDAVHRETLADRTDRRPSELAARQPSFEVPTPGISLHNAAVLLRDLIGRPVARLTADIVLQADERYSLRVRLTGHGEIARQDDFTADTIEAQLAAVAPQVWRVVAPRVFAWWLVTHEDRPDMQRMQLNELAREVRLEPVAESTVVMLQARALLRSGRAAEANTVAAELTARDPGYAPGWQVRAMALAELRRAPEAVEMLGRARTLDGGFAWSNKAACRLFLRLGRGEEALAEIRTARRLDPQDPDAMVLEVAALVTARRLDEAVAAARLAVERAPKHQAVQEALANALAAAQRPDLALTAIDRELAGFPPTISALVLRARLLLTLRRFDDTLAAADAALVHMPTAGPAIIIRAWAILELGRAQEALGLFTDLLRARPDLASVVHGRALALLALGRRRDAVAGLEQAVALQPDNRRAADELARLKAAPE